VITRTLLTVAFVAASGVALAQTSPQPSNQPSPGGATMPRDQSTTTPQQNRGQATSPTSPLATEGHAKSKLEGSGYSGIKDLKMNTDGTWSGKAMKDNREMAVSIDAQGNVTAR
jgi:hypothetical protein